MQGDSFEHQRLVQQLYPPSSMDLSNMTLFKGRYTLLHKIGAGGQGAVYKAWDTETNTHVAIKHAMCDPAKVEETPKEVLVMQSLKPHPLLPKFYDAYIKEIMINTVSVPYCFIVMELIEGMSLSQMFRLGQGGYVSIERTLSVTDTVSLALLYLHSNGVIHKDIKPANIVMTAKGNIFLVDLGLARFYKAGEGKDSTTRRQLGTRQYASPEQTIEGKTSQASDIYSLGVTMFELLTGENLNLYQQKYGLSNYQLTQEYVRGKRLPNALKTLVNSMTRPEREARPQDIRDVRMLLKFIKESNII